VGIFINIFILGLYIFTGIFVTGLELFGGEAVVTAVHFAEGVAPYVLEALVDTYTERLYDYSYSVAAMIDNVQNFELKMIQLQDYTRTRPQFEHVFYNFVHSRDFFFGGASYTRDN